MLLWLLVVVVRIAHWYYYVIIVVRSLLGVMRVQHRENPLENNCYHSYCWVWLGSSCDVDYSYLLVAMVMQQKAFQYSQSCEDKMASVRN